MQYDANARKKYRQCIGQKCERKGIDLTVEIKKKSFMLCKASIEIIFISS
jgi:hypothetical protein